MESYELFQQLVGGFGIANRGIFFGPNVPATANTITQSYSSDLTALRVNIVNHQHPLAAKEATHDTFSTSSATMTPMVSGRPMGSIEL